MDDIKENEPVVETEPQVESRLEGETEPEAIPASVVPPKLVRPRTPRRRPPDSSVSIEFLWLILPVVFALGLATGWLLWGKLPVPDSQVAADVTRYQVDEAGNPAIGPEDAPIEMIEFSDYQCPYCKQWYDSVHSRLLSEYEGKIRFVYRDMPLSAIHPDAQSAAEAADCAGEQGAYWQYHDSLFGRQYGLGEQAYTQYATDLGLDMNAFNTCVADHRYQGEVQNDASVGVSLGVTGTPTFFVNGLKVVGAQPYEVFKQIIDNELAEASPKN